MAPDRSPLPTAPRDHDRALQRHAHLARRAFVVGLLLFLVAALFGVFGERTARTTATGEGYELTVTYARATRPGLSSSIEWVVRRADGGPLPETVSLETPVSYLRLFDDHAVEPTPEQVRADGEELVWTFSPEADADELRVFLDGRIDPGFSPGRHRGTTTLYAGGEAVARADYLTWLWP